MESGNRLSVALSLCLDYITICDESQVCGLVRYITCLFFTIACTFNLYRQVAYKCAAYEKADEIGEQSAADSGFSALFMEKYRINKHFSCENYKLDEEVAESPVGAQIRTCEHSIEEGLGGNIGDKENYCARAAAVAEHGEKYKALNKQRQHNTQGNQHICTHRVVVNCYCMVVKVEGKHIAVTGERQYIRRHRNSMAFAVIAYYKITGVKLAFNR